MPRTRPAYPPEFRAQIVALARAGRGVEDLAREFEPCSHTIRGWICAAGLAEDSGGATASDPLSADERQELRRLRRENRQLRQERDILAKAAAWFAQNDATSSRSSTS
jgi:transposase